MVGLCLLLSLKINCYLLKQGTANAALTLVVTFLLSRSVPAYF
jgi:hypothetical protein